MPAKTSLVCHVTRSIEGKGLSTIPANEKFNVRYLLFFHSGGNSPKKATLIKCVLTLIQIQFLPFWFCTADASR